MGECNRCGKCCFIPTGEIINGQMELKACKFLLKIGDIFHCRIYSNRLGVITGEDNEGRKYYCTMYNSITSEIEGCPLNTGDKPVRHIEIINSRKAIQKELIQKEM